MTAVKKHSARGVHYKTKFNNPPTIIVDMIMITRAASSLWQEAQ
jgi:hypothetical protein